MRKLHRALTAAAAAALLTLTGCGNDVQKSEKTKTIYVICKSQDAFWDATKAGALEAGAEMGLNVIYEAPESDSQIGTQIRMIQEATSNGADVIVLAPLDKEALNDSLEQATSSGVSVLTIDSDVSFKGRRTCISTQNYSAGAVAARYAAELIGNQGDTAIITHSNTTQTAQERCGGFVDELSGKDTANGQDTAIPQSQMPIGAIPEGEQISNGSSYSDIHILETKNGEGNIQISCELTKQLISENPDLKLIYTTNQPGTIGACQAIQDLGAADRVQLIGFDYFKDADIYLKNGVLDAVIAQNPYNMGYLGVRYADKLSTGKPIAKNINTGVTLVTKKNMDDEDIRFLINPTGM